MTDKRKDKTMNDKISKLLRDFNNILQDNSTKVLSGRISKAIREHDQSICLHIYDDFDGFSKCIYCGMDEPDKMQNGKTNF